MLTWPPDVSMSPPSPPLGPPMAVMSPWASVRDWVLVTSDHNTALPPSPVSVAETSMLAPSAMATLTAWRISPLPCQSPPTRTSPPPVAPLASTVEVLASWMSSPSSMMRPPRLTSEVADSSPEFLTTLLFSSLAALADSTIRPPGARTAFLFSTRVSIWAASTCMDARVPLSANLSSNASPAASATVPISATMTPSLRTSAANRATYPPRPDTNSPALTTLPVAPSRVKVDFPPMKSSLLMLWVDATKAPTLTLEPGAK